MRRTGGDRAQPPAHRPHRLRGRPEGPQEKAYRKLEKDAAVGDRRRPGPPPTAPDGDATAQRFAGASRKINEDEEESAPSLLDLQRRCSNSSASAVLTRTGRSVGEKVTIGSPFVSIQEMAQARARPRGIPSYLIQLALPRRTTRWCGYSRAREERRSADDAPEGNEHRPGPGRHDDRGGTSCGTQTTTPRRIDRHQRSRPTHRRRSGWVAPERYRRLHYPDSAGQGRRTAPRG